MKLKNWAEEWLLNYIKPTVKVTTYKRYSQTINTHINPYLGEYELDDITPIVIQHYVKCLSENGNAKTKAGLSTSFINIIISILQNLLRSAYVAGNKKLYDANKIRRPKKESKIVECFNIEEQKKIERAIIAKRNTKNFGIILCLYTGLRIGELLALQWSDIDFNKGVISVNKSCYDGNVNGKRVKILNTPKTQTSHRLIPIPNSIIGHLKTLKKESTSIFVVSDRKRQSIYIRSYQKLFAGLLKKLKIPHRGFHSLRHTFATRAIECGMDVKTLSEILGHTNPTITLNLYTHSLMEHKTAMMNKLGKLL